MRNAPSVIYPVGRCRFFAVFLLLLALAALALLMLWWITASERSAIHRWAGWAGAAMWMVWALWATRDWRRSPRGRLEWDAHAPAPSLLRADGQGAWRWRDAGAVESTCLSGLDLALDLQMLVLLRLQGAGCHPRWTWVERWRDPARWNDLRRALHSSGA